MWVIRVNRVCYDTQTLLTILKESVRVGARRKTDSQQQCWYFQFAIEQTYQDFWSFIMKQKPLELP